MRIQFNKLRLHDFKGIRDFELEFDKDLTQIYADNGEGKSTLVDALFWLFFGKNSFGNSKFELFPLDKDNSLIPNTEPTVELTFTNGAKENTYFRSKDESKTSYKINNEKVTATEFKRHVGSVVTEELFSALLSPVYFGDNYTWQKQRDTILNNMKFENTIIGDFEYEDVAEEILENGVEQTLATYEKKRKECEKSKEQYVGTRDYLAEKLKDVDITITEKELVKQKDLKQKEIKDAEMALDSLHPIQTKMSELERGIQSIKNKHQNAIRDKQDEVRKLTNEMNNEFDKLKRELESKIKSKKQDLSFELKTAKSKKQIELETAKKEKDILLTSYKEKSKELKDVKDVCSLCGQKLDEFEVGNQRMILQEKLNEIKVQGTTKADIVKALEVELSSIKEDKSKLEEIHLLENKVANLSLDEDKLRVIDELNSEIQELNEQRIAEDEYEELERLEKKSADIKSRVDYDKIQVLRNELSAIEKQVREYESIVKDKFDLDETTKKLRNIMGDYDDYEDIIIAIKQYRTDYAQMIADALNDKLDRVQIKTFDLQKDGTLKETFAISMDGVPYASLNSAGKIEAGVELIRLLSESLSIEFPIVIDNKESITKDFDIPNQLITLSVKKGAKLKGVG